MTARSAIRVLRDTEARQVVLRRLADKSDYHMAAEELLLRHGFRDYAAIAHDNAVIAFRAWRDEMDDRRPAGLEVP